MTKEHVNTNHTFAICAYKESPYLEECITSLMEQTVKSEIFIATSTPNKYIDDIAAKYNLKVYVNEGESGITQDWNFAYSKVQTDYVTIAHQDDKYAPEYVENLLAYTAKAKKPLLFFTDYAEIRNGKIVTTNKILNDNKRSEEDYIMYQKFWPKCIAKMLTKAYSKSEESNNMKQG